MSEGYAMVWLPTTKGYPMDEFAAFIDHEAGFECDPYDVEAYYAEQILAYWD
jgi:hypothetical protein